MSITAVLGHDTIQLERSYSQPPSAVFRAYSDIDLRSEWSAPSDEEEVVFDAHDFRVGGVDQYRCGLKGQMSFAGTTRYEHIVDGELIVYTERLVTIEGALQAMSLVTWSVQPEGTGSRLTIVDQVASVDGDGPITGSRHGYAAMLEQLGIFLDSRS
jgi:uncharacterized protein YndB with AHSA1/START domain